MYVLISLVLFCVVLAALIDIIVRDSSQIRHLPKLTWVLLIIFLPLIGSIIWFAVGREHSAPVNRGAFGAGAHGAPDQHAAQTTVWSTASAESTPAARSTEQQIADLEREIAQSEAQERIKRLEAEIDQRRAEQG
ncbi:PLD nuclease N-terminal domain-containing protein [Salinibacterium sp. ZJ450]|uniref:PLD nuclease N-terminal domain-containing protein n=1 Tax=Salinibacterium sp. ZJ450 TaxID=2708338 RepID=UPI001422C367|nr:PLD nuclease N-terminal domain-containing protein [Salinibacterium sp. ZJ450]